VKLARALVALLLACVLGALLTLFVDPGYPVYPNALVPAVVPAVALGVLLRRSSRQVAVLAVAAAVLGGAVLVATAPSGPDRGRAVRTEQSLLGLISPYPGVRAGAVRTEPRTSSDWGINLWNPPESYETTRKDVLQADAVEERVAAAAYGRELRAHRFRQITAFRLHLPLGFEIDAVRGEGRIEIQVQNGVALLTAQCPACAS
jgi:hypothetical protein